MSQSKSEPFQITAVITIDDAGEPQAVTVEGIGAIPQGAVRAIAEEALDRHFGTGNHPFRPHTFGETIGDGVVVFEIRKLVRFGNFYGRGE